MTEVKMNNNIRKDKIFLLTLLFFTIATLLEVGITYIYNFIVYSLITNNYIFRPKYLIEIPKLFLILIFALPLSIGYFQCLISKNYHIKQLFLNYKLFKIATYKNLIISVFILSVVVGLSIDSILYHNSFSLLSIIFLCLFAVTSLTIYLSIYFNYFSANKSYFNLRKSISFLFNKFLINSIFFILTF